MNISFQVRRITYVMATSTNCLRCFSRTRTHIVFSGFPAHQSSVCHRLSRTYQHVHLFSISDRLERRICIVCIISTRKFPTTLLWSRIGYTGDCPSSGFRCER